MVSEWLRYVKALVSAGLGVSGVLAISRDVGNQQLVSYSTQHHSTSTCFAHNAVHTMVP